MEKIINKQFKLIGLRQERNFLILMIIIGMISNFWVISLNDGRMPVLADFEYSNNNHFTYQEKSEVKNWGLSDWIHIRMRSYNIYVSFGDIVIVIGMIGLIYIQAIYLKELFKDE